MKTTEEEQKTPAAELRKAFEEILLCARKIDLRCGGSVVHDYFIASVGRERFSRQTPLLIRSEKDSRGVTQHAIFGPGPVEQFLQVLERISPLEPGIEHSVRKNEIGRRRSAESAPDAKTAVLPKALDDHRVVVRMLLLDPAGKGRRVSVIAAAGTQRMDFHRAIAHPGIARRIQGNDFDDMPPASKHRGRLLDRLNRTAERRIN